MSEPKKKAMQRKAEVEAEAYNPRTISTMMTMLSYTHIHIFEKPHILNRILYLSAVLTLFPFAAAVLNENRKSSFLH